MKSQQNVVHFVSSPREREKWDRIASGEEAKIKIQDVEKNKQQSINRRNTNMSNFSQPAASPVDPYHTLSLISIFSKKCSGILWLFGEFASSLFDIQITYTKDC